MNKFNIEEVKEMSLAEQIVELDKQIQRVKEARERNAASIRHLEEMNENCNQQLETLTELKWSCKSQQRVNSVVKELGRYNGGDPDNEWMDKIK